MGRRSGTVPRCTPEAVDPLWRAGRGHAERLGSHCKPERPQLCQQHAFEDTVFKNQLNVLSREVPFEAEAAFDLLHVTLQCLRILVNGTHVLVSGDEDPNLALAFVGSFLNKSL